MAPTITIVFDIMAFTGPSEVAYAVPKLSELLVAKYQSVLGWGRSNINKGTREKKSGSLNFFLLSDI